MWILALLIIAALAGLWWLNSLPAGYSVSRQMRIQAPKEVVFDYVRDFKNWPQWSPWLIHEPGAALTYDRPNEIEGGYSWSGQIIGAGSLEHRMIFPHEKMEMRISFLRPFKSQAHIFWNFEAVEENGVAATEVTWKMESALPLWLRPLRGMMEHMIGSDFALGLYQLRGQLDAQAERPRLSFEGACTRPALTCLAQRYSGSLMEMGEVMRTAYPALCAAAADRISAEPLAAYHQVDLKKLTTVCDMAVPVNKSLPNENTLLIKEGSFFKVRLEGSYEFLACAWTSAQAHVRMKKIKVDKRRPSLEVYLNDPASVKHSNELITELYIPIR
jgi:Polyketide cyclase / dehydrase and lipid transport/GyrI-like small molecule binding domain